MELRVNEFEKVKIKSVVCIGSVEMRLNQCGSNLLWGRIGHTRHCHPSVSSCCFESVTVDPGGSHHVARASRDHWLARDP